MGGDARTRAAWTGSPMNETHWRIVIGPGIDTGSLCCCIESIIGGNGRSKETELRRQLQFSKSKMRVVAVTVVRSGQILDLFGR